MRYIVVGDIHGCLDELHRLVQEVAPERGDRFVFLGDLVDRGPDSVGVVQLVADLLGKLPGSACVAGNHEEKALRANKQGKILEPWHESMKPADWAFIGSLPLIHRFSGMIAVHGGLMPGFFRDHPEGIGEVPAAWHKGGGKKGERMRRFLRLRTVNAQGDFVALDQETPECAHWSSRYEGQEGFAFYDHEPGADVVVETHAMGLDTGCVFGGKLTAAIVPKGGNARNCSFVQVNARRAYAEHRSEE